MEELYLAISQVCEIASQNKIYEHFKVFFEHNYVVIKHINTVNFYMWEIVFNNLLYTIEINNSLEKHVINITINGKNKEYNLSSVWLNKRIYLSTKGYKIKVAKGCKIKIDSNSTCVIIDNILCPDVNLTNKIKQIYGHFYFVQHFYRKILSANYTIKM